MRRRAAWVLTCSVVLLQLCRVSSSESSARHDEIKSLVGQPHVGFRQFSGYIPVAAAVDEQDESRALFYYFVEDQTDPHSKPLVLWLTGGPGCSSVGSAFIEHGPFRIKGNDTLVTNPYSWNKVANMLYLDSPAGVGFSYSTNKSFYSYINDEITARDNLLFLQRWLERFPEYKNRDLYLAGESYAGHHISQLANLVLSSNLKSNLKGILLGAPLLDFNTDFNSKAEFYWSHGLISDSTYVLLNNVCSYSDITRQTNKGELSQDCSQVNSKVNNESRIGYYISLLDISADMCFQNQTPTVCCFEECTTYLNRKDVLKALRAELNGVSGWAFCSQVIKYDLQELERPILPILRTLVESGLRVQIFSGDQDPLIPVTGTRIDVNKLASELGLHTTMPYQAWLLDKQVGGWTQAYGDRLSFVLIRGSGHITAYSQPERTLLVFSKYLQGKSLPLAP